MVLIAFFHRGWEGSSLVLQQSFILKFELFKITLTGFQILSELNTVKV